MEFFVEENGAIEESKNPTVHIIAGAAAGIMEHCGMFPVDTIKTHLQIKGGTMISTTRTILRERGIMGLFRGVTAVATASAPIHGVSFAIYEFLKSVTGANEAGHHPLAASLSGMGATMVHDACIVPVDTIKQRLQFSGRDYKGIFDCISKVYQAERLRGFYRGYITTALMNIPYACIYYTTYETSKKVLSKYITNGKNEHNPKLNLISGGIAGAFAAGLTNPLDVSKTKLQVGADAGGRYTGMINALKAIKAENGCRGYFNGAKPRMISHSLAGAISWTTYEYIKYVLD